MKADKMTADITNAIDYFNMHENATKIRDTKELIRAYHVIDCTKKEVVVDIRMYAARSKNGQIVYCLFWAHNREKWITGAGQAGGYGYHKPSAAMGAAIDNAGITLSSRIHGVGESAMLEAMDAIAVALGARDTLTVEAFA